MPYEHHPSGPALSPLQEVLTPPIPASSNSRSSHRDLRSSTLPNTSSTASPAGPMSPDKDLPGVPPTHGRAAPPGHLSIGPSLRRLASPRTDDRTAMDDPLPPPSRPWASPGLEAPAAPVWRMPSPTPQRNRSRGRSGDREHRPWLARETARAYSEKPVLAPTTNGAVYRVPVPMLLPGSTRPLTVAERMIPTLELARAERDKCARRG
jgi:hypothetical protein